MHTNNNTQLVQVLNSCEFSRVCVVEHISGLLMGVWMVVHVWGIRKFHYKCVDDYRLNINYYKINNKKNRRFFFI